MANIDVDFAPATSARPRALVEAYRRALAEQPAIHRPPPAAPKFSRIDAGQLIRALFLVMVCLGLAQLPRIDRSQPDDGVVAAVVTPKPL